MIIRCKMILFYLFYFLFLFPPQIIQHPHPAETLVGKEGKVPTQAFCTRLTLLKWGYNRKKKTYHKCIPPLPRKYGRDGSLPNVYLRNTDRSLKVGRLEERLARQKDKARLSTKQAYSQPHLIRLTKSALHLVAVPIISPSVGTTCIYSRPIRQNKLLKATTNTSRRATKRVESG